MTAQQPSSLVYSADSEPGIRRETHGDRFAYRDPRGRLVRNRRVLRRIDSLVLPPAWRDVWICVDPDGHLQATGRDARGRKQYRYHPAWIAERDANKFDALEAFARVLPKIRRRVAQDLSAPQLSKHRVLAAIVQLIDRTFIRVGGERYRKTNGSFGATTLRNRHAQVSGDEIILDFRGKSGKRHRIELADPRVASVVRHCLEYPGQLFVYRDGNGVKSISAADVNGYLADASGEVGHQQGLSHVGRHRLRGGVPRDHPAGGGAVGDQARDSRRRPQRVAAPRQYARGLPPELHPSGDPALLRGRCVCQAEADRRAPGPRMRDARVAGGSAGRYASRPLSSRATRRCRRAHNRRKSPIGGPPNQRAADGRLMVGA